MRLMRLCPFVLFAVLATTSPALGQLETSAFANIATSVKDDAFNEKKISDEDEDRALGASSVFLSETLDIAAGGGSGAGVRTLAFADVNAKFGDLSIKGDAWVLGNQVPIGFASGTSKSSAGAKQLDVVELKTLKVAVGDKLLMRSRVKVKGGFTSVADFIPKGPPPAPPFDVFGQLLGQMQLFALGDDETFIAEPFDLEPINPVIARTCRFMCGPDPIDIPAPGTLYLTLIVPNGLPHSLGYGISFDLQASSDARVNAKLTADFSGSVHWDGILSVEDAVTGNVIDDWTITSASGFDYSRPFGLPEPSSIALLSFALCLWPGRARTRNWRS